MLLFRYTMTVLSQDHRRDKSRLIFELHPTVAIDLPKLPHRKKMLCKLGDTTQQFNTNFMNLYVNLVYF